MKGSEQAVNRSRKGSEQAANRPRKCSEQIALCRTAKSWAVKTGQLRPACRKLAGVAVVLCTTHLVAVKRTVRWQ